MTTCERHKKDLDGCVACAIEDAKREVREGVQELYRSVKRKDGE